MESRTNKISSFVAGVGLVTFFIGATQDIISAGQERGFWFPIILFILALLLYVLDYIPWFRRVFTQYLPQWKLGFILGMFFLAFVTLGIAIHTMNTDKGIIADTIPQISQLQKSIGLTIDKVDSIANSVDEMDNKLNDQNESFSGMMLSKTLESNADYIKNIYILHKNNDNKSALELSEKYLLNDGAYYIDFGELLYQILLDLNINADEYLYKYYIKSNNPNVLYTIYSRKGTSNNISTTILDYLDIHPDSIALYYLFYYDNFVSILDDPSIRDFAYAMKSQSFFTTLNQSNINKFFIGGLLSERFLSVQDWSDKIRAIGNSIYQYDHNSILSNLVGIRNTGQSMCVYKQMDTYNKNSESKFFIHDEKFEVKYSDFAVPYGYSFDNCNIDLSLISKNNSQFYISFIDNDGREYKYWSVKIEDNGQTSIVYNGK